MWVPRQNLAELWCAADRLRPRGRPRFDFQLTLSLACWCRPIVPDIQDYPIWIYICVCRVWKPMEYFLLSDKLICATSQSMLVKCLWVSTRRPGCAERWASLSVRLRARSCFGPWLLWFKTSFPFSSWKKTSLIPFPPSPAGPIGSPHVKRGRGSVLICLSYN